MSKKTKEFVRNENLVKIEVFLRISNFIIALILLLFLIIPNIIKIKNFNFEPVKHYLITFGIIIFLEIAIFNPFFKKVNKSNVNAKIRGVFYSINMVKIEWLTLIAALLSYLIFIFKKEPNNQTDISYNNVEFILTAVSFLTVFLGQLKRFWDFNKDLYYFRSKDGKTKELKIQDKLILTEMHIKNGYVKTKYISHGDEEYYIMSREVNNFLYNQNKETSKDNVLKFKKINYKFMIAEEIKQFVPFALKEKLESDRVLFNGKLVGQLTNLYLPDMITEKKGVNKMEILINQTMYYDALSTNHIVYKDIYHLNHINLRFDGSKMLINENNKILDFNESYLANHIGINTLALSKDGHIIIGLQGARSEVSAGKYINTGSGSLVYKDFKKFKKNKSLKDVIIYGTERELKEETGIPKNTKIKTELIGYMQVLKYGAKPDYFSVSVIDLNASEIIDFANSSKEIKEGLMGKYSSYPVGLKNIEENIIKEIDKLQINKNYTSINGKEELIRSAVQLEASKVIINDHLKRGVRVFENILNNKEWKQ